MTLVEACNKVKTEYDGNKAFRCAVISSVYAAIKSCPIGNEEKQAQYISDFVFGCDSKVNDSE